MSDLNIPEHWAEAKLEKICDVIYGKSLPDRERIAGSFPVASSAGIVGTHITSLIKGPLIVTGRKGTLGKPHYISSDAWVIDTAFGIKASSIINTKFLFWNLSAQDTGNLQSSTAIPSLSREALYGIDFPIPPIGEQERIVQKIESCFQKIDETEKALNEVVVLLAQYRESLLAKAFKGELIPQNPKDESASKLLDKMRAEQARSSNGKKAQTFSPISDDEKPFDLPKGWEWVRFQEATLDITDFVANGSFEDLRINVNVIDKMSYAFYVRLTDLRKGLGHSGQKYVDKKTYDFLRKSFLKGEEILLANVGANFGESMLMPILDKPATIAPNMLVIRTNNLISPELLQLYLSSCYGQEMFRSLVSTTAQPKFNKTDLRNKLIPVPPLKEQNLLLNHIKISISSIQKIETSLKVKLNVLLKMKESIFSKAFQGTLVSRVDNEGTGHELLNKILNSSKKRAEEVEEKVLKKSMNKLVSKKGKK